MSREVEATWRKGSQVATLPRSTMSDVTRLSPGELFAGRYRVENLLKAGGMGAVYIATHTSTRRRVALKVMHPDIVADAEARARFVQEAQVATLIQSAHVVDVLDAGVDEATGMPFLVMELLSGQELGELIAQRGRLPPHEVVGLLAQTARALDRAHAAGIVHRDLKPENLYLSVREDEPPRVKILDFGIAKMVQGAQQTTTRATGTPLYMAPEQTKRSAAIGPGTDVWALGLIAYTLLVGQSYWEAQDLNQLFAEILVDPLGSPVERAGRAGLSLPYAFDAWFFGCVSRDPSTRYVRASDAVVALASILGVTLDASMVSVPRPSFVPATAIMPSMSAHAPSAPSGSLPPPPPPPPRPHALGGATTGAPVFDQTGRRSIAPSRTSLYAVAGVFTGVAILVVGFFALRSTTSSDDLPTTPAPKTHHHVDAPVKEKETSPRERLEGLNPFLGIGSAMMQRHEITREEYAIYLQSLSERERNKARPLSDWSDETIDAKTKRRPVTWVSLERAERFCKLLDATVPTKEQWGEALDAAYPWGADWPDALEGIAIGRGETALPVDVETSKHDKTADGIYDLGGNVQEWTSTVADGLATVRGASIAMAGDDAKSAIKDGLTKYTELGAGDGAKTEVIAGSRLGFRCVRAK